MLQISTHASNLQISMAQPSKAVYPQYISVTSNVYLNKLKNSIKSSAIAYQTCCILGFRISTALPLTDWQLIIKQSKTEHNYSRQRL